MRLQRVDLLLLFVIITLYNVCCGVQRVNHLFLIPNPKRIRV